MPKEYRTIQEVAGPLMLVKGVEGVAYDELGEIQLSSGEKRRCKVLEINEGNALVQLFESSTGINLESSKVRFLGRSMELGVSGDMLGRVFDGLGRPIDGGPEILAEAVKVLRCIEERYGHHFTYVPVCAGGCAIDRYGTSLPKESLEACLDSDSVLLAAVGAFLLIIGGSSLRPHNMVKAFAQQCTQEPCREAAEGLLTAIQASPKIRLVQKSIDSVSFAIELYECLDDADAELVQQLRDAVEAHIAKKAF